MESGGSSNQSIRFKYSRRSRSERIVIQEPNAATNTAPAPVFPAAPAAADQNPPPGFKRDPDQYMPIANVVRIMRRILPPHAKIADDAKETIQECVSEFISFITTEANGKCHSEYRKTVTPDDVLAAMKSLGFDKYVETLTVYLNKYRANDPERGPTQQLPTVRRTLPSFVQRPVAQRPRQQLQASASAMVMGYVPLPPSEDGNYSGLPVMTDFFVSNQGGGEGTSREVEEFDPFK